MKIAYITFGNARDIKNWSGVVSWMLIMLESIYGEVLVIDKIEKIFNPLIFLCKIIEKICGRSLQYRRLPVFLKPITKKIERKLQHQKVDLLFSPSSLPFAYLQSNIPKVYWIDATFNIMVEYYPEFSRLPMQVIKWGNFHEKKSLENVDLAVFGSEWAAKSAIRDYNINPSKVLAIPMGANLDNLITEKTAESIIEERISRDTIQLLSIGADWVRKGFDLSIHIAEEIYNLGHKVELHLVGASPPYSIDTVFPVIHHGKLFKNVSEQKTKLLELYQKSHFFILPSVAECAGMVFAEASAYALPSITRNTGGIPSMVKDGTNGFVLDYDAPPNQYARKIIEIFSDKKVYRNLCYQALDKFYIDLNWPAAFVLFNNAVERILKDPSSESQKPS